MLHNGDKYLADGGRKFGELMEKATGGKVKVNVYATDQLTNGNQSEGIQALMNGDPVQISMHSNLIYSAFDPRFNVVSLPFIYDSYDDADAKFDGAAGEKLKELLSEYVCTAWVSQRMVSVRSPTANARSRLWMI